MDINQLQKSTSTMEILYVEDDIEIQTNTRMIFEDLFAKVDVANDGVEGLEKYKNSSYDIVITDINMPKMNGIELIQHIHTLNPKQIIIIISAHNETEYFIDGIQSGIDGYLLKPIDYNQLFVTLEKISSIIQNRKENLEYRHNLEKLVKEKTKHIEQNYQRLRELLTIDKLTGIPNANMLYQYIDYLENKKITLFLMKIDNFNYISQTYTKEICNQIIKTASEFIALNIAPDGKLYRLSEEEFAVLFESANETYSTNLAIQINAFLKETPVAKSLEQKDIYITLSNALVVEEEADNILQKARACLNELYNQKVYGHFKLYSENSNYIKELKSDNKWFEKIREIIEENHLVPYFHPIVSNNTGEIVRYECLIRADEDGKIISPISFLESVKRAGLMSSLSRVMINKCFNFFSNTDLHFSINITNEDILDEKFADFVIAKQSHYGIAPKQVTFEILEDIILDEKCTTSYQNLQKLKKSGFLLALDDFGNNRSNLSRFMSLVDFDYIKIDGQFIKDIDKNDQNFKIVNSIVQLAKGMHLEIVAEYVSTKEEFETVKALGIDYSQGYFFHKPEKNI